MKQMTDLSLKEVIHIYIQNNDKLKLMFKTLKGNYLSQCIYQLNQLFVHNCYVYTTEFINYIIYILNCKS